jgi:hypothetical protein
MSEMITDLADPAELDPLIRETVLLLRGAGFKTFSSCQGTKGHGYHLPTVRMNVDEGASARQTRDRLIRFLADRQTTGFTVHCAYDYGGPEHGARTGEWLWVDFWCLSCLPPATRPPQSVIDEVGVKTCSGKMV